MHLSVVLANRDVFSGRELLIPESEAMLVVAIRFIGVVEGPTVARAVNYVATLILPAGAELAHTVKGAVLAPGVRVDATVFR